MSHRHTVCWTMIELKSVDESEQSLVNILWQFWIESDNRSSHKFWILKSIYQNYTTSTLYHYIWLPSSGIPTWHIHNMAPIIGKLTMLIFHKWHNLTDWSAKKLKACVCYFLSIFISYQIIALQRLWKKLFIWSKKFFSFLRY